MPKRADLHVRFGMTPTLLQGAYAVIDKVDKVLDERFLVSNLYHLNMDSPLP